MDRTCNSSALRRNIINLTVALLLSSLTIAGAHAQVVKTAYPGAAFHPVNSPAGDMSQGIFNRSSPFTVSNGTTTAKWVDTITPVVLGNQPVTLVDPTVSGSQVNYINTLEAAFPTWTFDDSPENLAPNSLIVKTYATLIDGANPNPGVGADFDIQYNPAAGADNPPAADTHWIQVLTTNWKLGSAPPTNDTKVDNLGAAVPYYDDLGAATSTQFWDAPERDPTDPANALWNGTAGFQGPVTWTAEDYLVSDDGPNGNGGETVDIWGGVRYGFTLTLATPEPGVATFACVLLGFTGFISLRRRSHNRRSTKSLTPC